MERNIVLYIFSTIVVTLGGIVYTFAISYFILEETGSPLYFSINTAIMSIGAILSLPISGVLVDSWDKKKIIIFLETLSFITLLLLTIYISIFGFNVSFLFAITAVRSIIIPIISNAFDASLTQLFDKESIQKTLGKIATYETSISLLGPILAGVLYGFLTLQAMVTVFLIMQLLSVFANIFLNFKSRKNESTNIEADVQIESWFKKFIAKLTVGFKYITKSETLLKLLILSLVINFVGAASFSVLPETIMIKELNFDATQVGIVSAIFGLGSLLGSLSLSKITIKNPLKIVRTSFVYISVLLLSFTLPVYYEINTITSMIYIALIGLTMAFVFQFINISISSYLQKTVSDEYKGRVFSTNSTIGMILLPIGTVTFGFLYENGIYFSVNLFSSIIILITIFFTLNKHILSRSVKEYNN